MSWAELLLALQKNNPMPCRLNQTHIHGCCRLHSIFYTFDWAFARSNSSSSIKHSDIERITFRSLWGFCNILHAPEHCSHDDAGAVGLFLPSFCANLTAPYWPMHSFSSPATHQYKKSQASLFINSPVVCIAVEWWNSWSHLLLCVCVCRVFSITRSSLAPHYQLQFVARKMFVMSIR